MPIWRAKTSVARQRGGCDWGWDAALHPALLHPCSVTLGCHHRLPSEGKDVSKTWASSNVEVASGCFPRVLSGSWRSRPFSRLLLNVQWWCFGPARQHARAAPSTLQSQGGSHNPMFCVPFKTEMSNGVAFWGVVTSLLLSHRSQSPGDLQENLPGLWVAGWCRTSCHRGGAATGAQGLFWRQLWWSLVLTLALTHAALPSDHSATCLSFPCA